MRKHISFLLIAFILFSIMPSMPILASTGFDVVDTQSFDAITALPDTVTDSGGTDTLSLDTTTFAEDALQKSFIKLAGASSGYAQLKIAFDEIKSDGANRYAEISFDMYTYGVTSVGSNITMRINNKAKTLFLANGGDIYIGENTTGTKLAETEEMDSGNWTNYKFVFHLTDAEENPVNKIVGVYQNGVSVIKNVECPFNDTYTSLTNMTLQLSQKSGEYWLGVDNFFVATYTSADGVSPVPDKTALKQAITSAVTTLEEQRDELEAEDASAFETQMEALVAVYHRAAASIQEVQTAKSEAEVLVDEIARKAQKLPDYLTVYANNFNDTTELPAEITATVDDTLAVDGTTFAEDAFHQKALKLVGVSKDTGYPKIKVTFDEIKSDGVNKYAELSFDLYTHAVKQALSAITLQINQGIGKFYMSSSGGLYIGEDTSGTKLASTAAFDAGEWVNYRFVFQLTDADGNPVNQIVGVYEDGVNVIEAGATCSFEDTYTSLQGMSLQLSPKTVEYEYYLGFDNLLVMSYYSEDGSSQVPERAALMYAAKQADAALAEESGRYSETDLAAIEKNRQIAMELFYQETVTAKEIETVVEALKFALKRNAVQFSGISVKKADGSSVGYLTGGTLEKILVKKYDEVQDTLTVVAAVHNENGVLEQCGIGTLDTAAAFQNTDTAEVLLTVPLSEDIRSKQVRFLLWDENYRPYADKFDFGTTKEQEYALTYNETSPLLAVSPFLGEDGALYLPAKQMVHLLGMSCEEMQGSYTAESDYGARISFRADGGSYNGNSYSAVTKEGIIMLPAQMFTDAFGIEANADEFTAKATVLAESAVKEYDASPHGLVTYTATDCSVHYQIHAAADAKVEVWYKRSYTGHPQGIAWNRAQECVYQNDAWVGGIAGVAVDYFHFRIRITEGDTVKTYEDRNAVSCKGIESPTLEEMVGSTGGELRLHATYENIGYAIDLSEAASCTITYREKGKSWAQAYAPSSDNLQFRGSIVGLKDGTEYEVKAVLLDAEGNEISTKTASVTTQSNEPTITKTVKLSEIYQGGGLMLSGYHGSEDGWIRIVNDGTVIDAGSTHYEAVLVEDSSYIILDGFQVKGGYRYGINIADNASHIRITNCDISGWGRPGVLDESRGRYVYDGADINFDAGIAMLNADHVTVERCYIHNSAAQTNSWRTANWSDVHPQGCCGIYYSSKDSAVIRYNDIIGNYQHLYNDGIEGYSNSSRNGAAANNCDIYGNMIYLGEDDGVELDGGQLNARVYQNRIERFYCGVSLAPNMTGPSYLFRNQIVNLGTTYHDRVYTALKIGGSVDGVFGMHYLFNNTIDSDAHGATNSNYNGTTEFHSVSANNIFVTRKNGSNSYGFRNIYANERDNNDYDLVGGKFYLGQTEDGTPIDGSNTAKNSLQGYPLYVNADRGNYRLAGNSPGVGSGTYLDNFCEEISPNMGVYSKNDTTSFMPYRPTDMKADKYKLTLSDGKPQTVTITFGEEIDGESFTVLTDNAWLTTSINGGTVVPGQTVSFTVTADFSKAATSEAYGDEKYGMVLVRLDNGYSIPVAITLNK